MAFDATHGDQDRQRAEAAVADMYRAAGISAHPVLYALSRLSKTLLGRVAIGAVGVVVAGAVATVAAPGLAIAAGGFAATLLVAQSRNAARQLEWQVADAVAEKKKSGAFDQQVHHQVAMIAEQKLRLHADIGGNFNDRTQRAAKIARPLTGGDPRMLAAMRMR